MHGNKLFYVTHWRLTSYYAGVMGLVLSLSALVFYKTITYADQQALQQELESIAGTLHDSIEPKLLQPGQLEASVQDLLPGLCVVGLQCQSLAASTERHVMGTVQQDSYYLRFLDRKGQVVATLGDPLNDRPTPTAPQVWQTLTNSNGEQYQQLTLLLKTHDNNSAWGYMQIGRSLKDLEQHQVALRWALLAGLPSAIVLTTLASWWLAGLAVRPVYCSYQQIQQFTADAAHELRTPVTAIQALVEFTLQMANLLESEARNTFQTIARQNDRLDQLVKDMLFLSQTELQKEFKHKPCYLNNLITNLLEELTPLALSANLSLTANLQVHQPLFVLGDETQLYRLVTNLIVNAIRYTPAQGKVCVQLIQEGHHALIRVQDTGIGIADADLARIFDRFYRGETDRSRSTGGSGLGLPIAQAIAHAHQGDIHVQTEFGKGSLFTVYLPLHFVR